MLPVTEHSEVGTATPPGRVTNKVLPATAPSLPVEAEFGEHNDEFSCAAASDLRSSPTDPLRHLHASVVHRRRQLQRHVMPIFLTIQGTVC